MSRTQYFLSFWGLLLAFSLALFLLVEDTARTVKRTWRARRKG